MPVTIPVFGLEWHMHKSPSQNDVLLTPLSPYINFERFGWDGLTLDVSEHLLNKSPIIFYEYPPPKKILKNPRARIVWIPMWDDTARFPPIWWDALPQNVRIVSFSKKIEDLTYPRNIRTLSLRLYKNPGELSPAVWSGERILYYWNRTGMVTRAFLEKLCKVLDVDTLLFRPQLDPNIPSRLQYFLPPKIGKTKVENIPGIDMLSRDEYIQLISRANIVLAPRELEGVGLVLLEALARGCAVFAFNAPTMNEYITHKVNGYLLSPYYFGWNTLPCHINRKVAGLIRGLWGRVTHQRFMDYKISEWQDWESIRQANLIQLGTIAAQRQAEGYALWKNSIKDYSRFVLDW